MEYFPKTLSADESDDLLAKLIKKEKTYGYGFWAVELIGTSEFIGFIGFNHCDFISDFTPCIEIGWRIKSEYWGQGYATEAAKACLAFGGKNLGLENIYSFTAINNIRSRRVMEKSGFNYVKDFEHPLVSDPQLKAHALYQSTLKSP
jgi:[ribosomal protein S5]-alanine N-acetyltransferase